MVDRGLPDVPVAERTTVGYQLIDPADLPALAGRTIYAVVDATAPTGVATTFAHFAGGVSGSTLDLRSQGGGQAGDWAARPQFPGGGGAGGAYYTVFPQRTVGRRAILMTRLPDGLTSIRVTGYGQSAQRTGMDAGSGIPAPRCGIITSAYDTCLHLQVYRGAHTWQQACQVHQWLAARWAADPTPPPIW